MYFVGWGWWLGVYKVDSGEALTELLVSAVVERIKVAADGT
jgi:hypothetical protein